VVVPPKLKPSASKFATAPFATAPFASQLPEGSAAPAEEEATEAAPPDTAAASTAKVSRVAGIAGTLILLAGAVVAFARHRPRD
jgi:hypothetical protein